jgi:hypothetical protein
MNSYAEGDARKSVPGADAGFEISRTISGYAYAANGNLHNPTPRYTYLLWLDGKLADSDPRYRKLVASAREYGRAGYSA